jgi:hypothetical protein
VLLALLTSHGASAASFVEDFSSNPFQQGWKVFGDTNLFQWNSVNQELEVTWDSAQANSYFYLPLRTVLTRRDDFSFSFDLRLTDIGPGPDTNKSSSFEIGIGLLNLDQATKTNFIRGTGSDSPNLAELSYFWDAGFGATTWPVLIDTNSAFNYNGPSDYAIFALAPGDWYHVLLRYTASNETLIATLTNAADSSGRKITQPINSSFSDYRLGSFSVSSYSDAGQDPQFAGSVLAHGTIDNVVVTVPDPPLDSVAGAWSNGAWRAQLVGKTNWVYFLEKTFDFQSWSVVSAPVPGTGSQLTLSDTNSPGRAGFYRVGVTRL